jgi:hypothetical protein
MTEPLPCPFCGHVGLSHNEGSTFRWLSTECNGCGAQCGEERINTMTMERSAAIEQAKVAAIKTWNTRFTPFPPQQQAEPPPEWESIKNILDEYGLDAIAFASAWKAVQQRAEPVAWMDREGDLYKMPEIKNWAPPHTMLYTTPPQRQWDKPSTNFNDWWNGDYDDSANPFEQDSAAYWAWAGWQAAHRQWQGLTDEEVNRESASIDARLKLAFHSGMYVAQIILKEKNT